MTQFAGRFENHCSRQWAEKEPRKNVVFLFFTLNDFFQCFWQDSLFFNEPIPWKQQKAEGKGDLCVSHRYFCLGSTRSVFPQVTDFLGDQDKTSSHLSHLNASLLCCQASESQEAVWVWVFSVSFTSLHHPPPSPLPNCTWFYFPVLQTMNSARLTWHKVPTNFVPATVDGRFRAQAEKLTLERGEDTFPFDQRKRQGV